MPQFSKATLEKEGMRVDFHWQGDRFGHTVSRVRDGQVTAVWRSAPTDDRAPAFQELHEQTTGDGNKILFLSGSGGGAHWSVAVEQDGKAIAFDVAVRVAKGSVAREVVYEKVAEGDAPLLGCGHMIGSSRLEESRVIFLPEPTAAAEPPCTLRLKYAFF